MRVGPEIESIILVFQRQTFKSKVDFLIKSFLRARLRSGRVEHRDLEKHVGDAISGTYISDHYGPSGNSENPIMTSTETELQPPSIKLFFLYTNNFILCITEPKNERQHLL